MMSLKALYNSYLNHKESQWIMKPENAQALFAFCSEHKELRNILDLGTGIGCSAAIIALALKQEGNKYFHIDTVEQYENCHKLAQELMPQELKDSVTFHKVDEVVWSTDEIPHENFMNFKELPKKAWDLIITDGPGPFLEDGKLVELPNGDVLRLHMEGKIKPGTFLMFDGRIKALSYLERYFSSNFYTFEPVNSRCNILERKDNPVAFEDLRLLGYQRDGYFKE